jgi:hypothetical protein
MTNNRIPNEARDGCEISWATAEYLAILVGQVPFGNMRRRDAAAADLGNAMRGGTMDFAQECFQDPAWDITSEPKGQKRHKEHTCSKCGHKE